jgi:hypothetical protein
MEQAIPNCPQRMDSATLGAWRDRELPPTQGQRVEAHVRGCRACQQALSEMDLIGRAIRRYDPPQMQDAIWRDVQMTMQEQRGNPMPARQQKTAILGGLGALAIVTVLAAVILVFTATKPEASSTQTIVATAALSPTATPPTLGLTVAPGQDWTTLSALPNGLKVAFAPSAPLTGYACVQGTAGSQVLSIAVTHDGGNHWQHFTPGNTRGVQCTFTINPIDANDVVMLGSRCFGGCGDNNNIYAYRTRDSGQTWSTLALPTGAVAPYTLVGRTFFAGDALYMESAASVSANGTDAQHELAVSVAGGAARWLDIGQFTSPFAAYAIDGAFYLAVGTPGGDVTARYLEKTTDAGGHWSKVVSQGISQNIETPFIAADQRALYGFTAEHKLVVSHDGERWATPDGIPGPPGISTGGYNGSIVAAAPDGTFYFFSDGDLSVYRFTPGSHSWQQITTFVNTAREIIAVSNDAQGHPVALWASNIHYPSSGSPIPLLEYRAP